MNFTTQYQKALIASGGEREAIASASKTCADSKYGEDKYHDAQNILALAFEVGLRKWIKANPPEKNTYTKDTPMRAVYLYCDTLENTPGIVMHVVKDKVSRVNFHKIVLKALQQVGSKAKSSEKNRVVARYAEYPQVLREILQAKREWKNDDARIRTTHAFRMMGGLTRMGTGPSMRYADLVKKAQTMEESVLGKVLTKYTKV